ncbi:MAG: hypothetical protein R6U98_12840 [Pirellulaceae bacterium]
MVDGPASRGMAQRQLDWGGGKNPYRASTIEGVGYSHPPRFVNSVEFHLSGVALLRGRLPFRSSARRRKR